MSKKEFWDIAHRGGEAYAPENTMAAFKLTMEYGIGWIETDVRGPETISLFYCTTSWSTALPMAAARFTTSRWTNSGISTRVAGLAPSSRESEFRLWRSSLVSVVTGFTIFSKSRIPD